MHKLKLGAHMVLFSSVLCNCQSKLMKLTWPWAESEEFVSQQFCYLDMKKKKLHEIPFLQLGLFFIWAFREVTPLSCECCHGVCPGLGLDRDVGVSPHENTPNVS